MREQHKIVLHAPEFCALVEIPAGLCYYLANFVAIYVIHSLSDIFKKGPNIHAA